MHIGKTLRQLRHQKEWTLADLAKASGVTLSTLSRIETNTMTGTLESHLAISKALGVRLTELYENVADSPPEILRAQKQNNWLKQKDGVQRLALVEEPLDKQMLPTLVQLAAGESFQIKQGKKSRDCWLYVTKGRIDVIETKGTLHLKQGDSLYCTDTQPLEVKNNAKARAELIQVTSPPLF